MLLHCRWLRGSSALEKQPPLSPCQWLSGSVSLPARYFCYILLLIQLLPCTAVLFLNISGEFQGFSNPAVFEFTLQGNQHPDNLVMQQFLRVWCEFVRKLAFEFSGSRLFVCFSSNTPRSWLELLPFIFLHVFWTECPAGGVKKELTLVSLVLLCTHWIRLHSIIDHCLALYCCDSVQQHHFHYIIFLILNHFRYY